MEDVESAKYFKDYINTGNYEMTSFTWQGTPYPMMNIGQIYGKGNSNFTGQSIKELNEPRYMSVSGVFEAYSKPLTTFDYEALKDDPLIDSTTIGLKGSPTNIFKSFTPPQKGAGMMLEGADKDTCDKLAGILAAKHLI